MTAEKAGNSLGDLDSSRAFRGAAALTRLVQHVHRYAHNKNELDWIEWKRTLDFSTVEHRFEAAKHILGFANRMPDVAQLNAGGCAYLLIGVEPGNLAGTSQVDNSALVPGLSKYLGDDGPAWSPLWLSHKGKDILIITVEPPEWGDRMHALRTAGPKFQNGTIFHRLPGSTPVASWQLIRLLEDRFAQTGGMPTHLQVRQDGGAIATLDTNPRRLDELVDTERDRLLAPLRKDQRKAAQRQDGPTIEIRGNIDGFLEQQAMAARIGHALIVPEDRTPEEFEAEVEAYLLVFREWLRDRLITIFMEKGVGTLAVEVSNPSEDNLPSLEIELVFSDTVDLFPDGLPYENLEPPRAWGSYSAFGPSGGRVLPDLSSLANSLYHVPTADPGYQIRRHGDETVVIFDPIDLRPHKTVPLPAFELLIEASSGPVACEWRATSTHYTGRSVGNVELQINPEPYRIEQFISKVNLPR